MDAIAVALIGGAAGLSGAILGAWIGARSARQVAEANREEAREARFANRITELAVILTGDRHLLVAVGKEVQTRQRTGKAPTKASIKWPDDWDRCVVELRLVTRHRESRAAVDRLDAALDDLWNHATRLRRGTVQVPPLDTAAWEAADIEGLAALDWFEAAILAELGVGRDTRA